MLAVEAGRDIAVECSYFEKFFEPAVLFGDERADFDGQPEERREFIGGFKNEPEFFSLAQFVEFGFDESAQVVILNFADKFVESSHKKIPPEKNLFERVKSFPCRFLQIIARH